jgi:hypothetical protein
MQKVRRAQLIKLPRLLNMMYRPSEIATELDVTTETITRSYLPAGAPFEQDKGGNIWIHGLTFAAWVRSVTPRRGETSRLADGEGFCFKCSKAVMMMRPRKRSAGRYTAIWQGKCPICGGKVNRAYAASDDVTGTESSEVRA